MRGYSRAWRSLLGHILPLHILLHTLIFIFQFTKRWMFYSSYSDVDYVNIIAQSCVTFQQGDTNRTLSISSVNLINGYHEISSLYQCFGVLLLLSHCPKDNDMCTMGNIIDRRQFLMKEFPTLTIS